MFLLLYSEIMAINPSYGLTVNRVLATVNNEVITLSDYQRFVTGMGNIENKDVVDEVLLKRLVEERVILIEARKRGVKAGDEEVNNMIAEFQRQNNLSQEEFGKVLSGEGMNMQDYRRLIKDKIITMKLIDSNVDSKVVVTNQDIEDFYNVNKYNFLISPEKVKVKAIFLKLSEDASVTEITDLKRKTLKIKALLKDGNSFDSLVARYSDEPLKGQDGMLGEFARGEMVLPLGNNAFSMKKGEISEPIWVREGVYILNLINKTEEVFDLLDNVREEIRMYLYAQKREKLFNEWMKTLWEKTSIKIIN
ncbi:MAG: peptidylprolyl isomerase [Nitrospirae bacterium]|nr:peptidylprolyl isomerase [Nitrospirota bacterium]